MQEVIVSPDLSKTISEAAERSVQKQIDRYLYCLERRYRSFSAVFALDRVFEHQPNLLSRNLSVGEGNLVDVNYVIEGCDNVEKFIVGHSGDTKPFSVAAVVGGRGAVPTHYASFAPVLAQFADNDQTMIVPPLFGLVTALETYLIKREATFSTVMERSESVSASLVLELVDLSDLKVAFFEDKVVAQPPSNDAEDIVLTQITETGYGPSECQIVLDFVAQLPLRTAHKKDTRSPDPGALADFARRFSAASRAAIERAVKKGLLPKEALSQ